VLALALLPTRSFAAGPTPSPRPLAGELSAAQAQLTDLDNRLDVADESYREGQLAWQQATLDQAAADRALAAGKARVARLQGRVNRIVSFAYQSGASADVLVATPSGAEGFAESTALLAEVASQQDSILSAAATAQHDLAVAQTAADQAAAATARTTAALAAAKADIVDQVAQHQTIVASLVTRQHTLEAVAAEKARLAAIAEARARAARDAAARKAAQAAAAAAQAAAQQAAADAAAAKAVAQREAAQQAADRRQALAQAAARARQTATTDEGSTPSGSAGPPSSRAAVAVQAAYRQLGDPYDWAADGPASFDCSGLTAYAWAAAGVSLPHSSRTQFDVGSHVSRRQLAPGDLVFFGSPIHHVGLYIGNGQMIDAPQTGDVVRVQSISRSDYAGAVRVTG
jgi:cell wall-associated NlpC family hydrolase